jgi:hypothetical protein
MAYGYTPNPGYPSNTAAAACPVTTPQKVCGALSPPGPDDLEVLQYQQIDATNGSGAATPFVSTTTLVLRAVLSAPSTNTADITIGPNSSANADTIGAGQGGFEIPAPDGVAFDLNKWFWKSAAAGQKLTIQFLPAPTA